MESLNGVILPLEITQFFPYARRRTKNPTAGMPQAIVGIHALSQDPTLGHKLYLYLNYLLVIAHADGPWEG